MIRQLTRNARKYLLASARSSGLSGRLASSRWRRNRLLILCYHGIALEDEHVWDPELFITAEFLDHRLQLIRDADCNVLPLGEAVRRLHDRSLPPRAVVITFDDGLYDFHAAAAPVLAKHGMPATIYVSTYHCLQQRPLLRLSIRFLLWRARDRTVPAEVLPDYSGPRDLQSLASRDVFSSWLYAAAQTHCARKGEQMDWLGGVVETLGLDWQAFLRSRVFHLMNLEEISEIARQGIDVQLHTHRHRTPRDETMFKAEIIENQRILQNATGICPRHFCYPSGDYDSRFLPWLTQLGIESATTCDVALAATRDNSLLLPRFVDTMGQGDIVFQGWLSGVAHVVSRRHASSH